MSLLLHPPLTSFPVAFVLLSAALEVGRLGGLSIAPQVQRVILAAAVCGSLGAFVSGLIDSGAHAHMSTVQEQAVSFHYEMGRLLVGVVILVGFFFELSERLADAARRRTALRVFRLCLLLAVLLVAVAGFTGGRLVFEHRLGVAGWP